MLGYVDDPSRDGAVLTAGRYWTGDVGVRDQPGWVRLVGRRDDVFKSSGHRVSPYELEALFRAHPAVREAAVVAVPHPLGGAVPHAVVVPIDGVREADLPSRLLAYVGGRVAPSLRLHAVHVADRLPRTPSGKVRRSVLGEWIRATTGAAAEVASLDVASSAGGPEPVGPVSACEATARSARRPPPVGGSSAPVRASHRDDAGVTTR